MLELQLQNGDIVRMEHSLLAIAKWESLTCKPYFNPFDEKSKTSDETWLYINCMVLDEGVQLNSGNIGHEQMEIIQAYLSSNHTATELKHNEKPNRKRYTTSEMIYATMIKAGLEKSYETWNIDRLLTLLGVIADMMEEKKPMTKQEIYEQNIKLNAERRAKLKSKG